MQPQETEIKVNLLKFSWKITSGELIFGGFLSFETVVVRRVISQETKAKAYPGALKKTKIETAFRGQDKRVKITVYTILPYFVFHYLTNPGQ